MPEDMENKARLVGIVMGSASDAEIMLEAKRILDEFGVTSEVRVLSAHRTPEQTADWAAGAAKRGMKVIIAGAGMAAHLAGVVAAQTEIPVIGVPLEGGMPGGIDALLSMVQMPKGIPVAVMSVGRAGAVNAGLFAVSILALQDDGLKEALRLFRRRRAEEVVLAERRLLDGM